MQLFNSMRDFAVSNLIKVLNNGVFENSMRKNRQFNSLATISITETVEDYFDAELSLNRICTSIITENNLFP